MAELRGFIFSLLIISVSGAAVTMFLPENTKTAKYVHFLIGIIVTSVLLMPISSIKGTIPELITNDIEFDLKKASSSAYTDAVVTQACLNIEQSISDSIYERFDVRPTRIKVESNGDYKNLLVNSVEIYYAEKNKLLYSDTLKFTQNLFDVNCEVRVMYEGSQ